MNFWIFLAMAALASTTTYAQKEYRRVCYVTNWSQYRPPPANFYPNQTDTSLCTHIMFAFAVISADNTIASSEWNDDIPGGLYYQTLALREKEPGLKVLIAVGGHNVSRERVTLMLETAANRSTFIGSAITFCRTRCFDGIDLDFDNPGIRGSPPPYSNHYTSLLEEFRTAITIDATSSGKTPLLLTVAVPVEKMAIDGLYEVPLISQHVDFLSLKTIFFYCDGTVTSMSAPLYPRQDQIDQTCNVDWAAKYWVSLGAPKDKLVIGLPVFGRCFTLADPAQNGLGAPVVGPCTNETYTKDHPGFLSYYEICITLSEGATRVFDDEHKTPYAYKRDQWVGYDDEQNLQIKVDYIVENGFSGWVIWSLDLDDFTGDLGCNSGPYPLHSTASDRILMASSSVVPTITTAADPTTTANTTTTATPFSCVGKPNGNYVNPADCSSFFMCSNEVETLVECAEGLLYDDVIKTCNWPNNLSEERQAECGVL